MWREVCVFIVHVWGRAAGKYMIGNVCTFQGNVRIPEVKGYVLVIKINTLV